MLWCALAQPGMSSVTSYQNDLFISYSHIDNQPFLPGGGWVDIFHAALQNFLDVRVGRRVAVWRDARLSGAEAFSDAIEVSSTRWGLWREATPLTGY